MSVEAATTHSWRRTLVGVGRSPRVVMIITAVLGIGAAVAVTALAAPRDRTFAAVAGPVQSLMSITVPFLGVLLVRERRRRGGSVLPAMVAAEVVAVAFALLGVVAAVTATAVAPSTAGPGRWQHAFLIGLGSILVQALAQLIGTGFGRLIRSAVVACLATFVFPLGLWLLLGAAGVLVPLRDWLTPFEAARHLLSGQMSGLRWVQWLVVAALWGVGLHLIAARRALRR